MDQNCILELVLKTKKVVGCFGKENLLITLFNLGKCVIKQSKDNHLRQLNSFKMLSDRYRALSEHDETIDIMNEAQKMKNLTILTSQKFMAYLHTIASKLMAFVEEMTAKCQNFGN